MRKFESLREGKTAEVTSRFRFFYFISLLSTLLLSLTGPFWVIYFEELGLTYLEISLLIIANHGATLVFEIPTGAVADFWGRKPSVVIALLISGSASIGIFLARELPQLLLLFALSGIGATFMSGAYSAWFVEALTSAGMEESKKIDLTGYWGHLASGQQLGSILGFLLGSALVSIGYLKRLWLIEGLGILLIALYILVFGKEASHMDQCERTTKRYLKIIVEGSTYLFKDRLLSTLIVGSFLWFLSTGILSVAWQPYFREQGLDPKYFGIILAGYSIVGILLARKTGIISQRAGGELRLLWLIGVGCGGFTLLMLAVPGFSWIPFIIYGGIYSLQQPAFQGYLNRLLPSSLRATVLSTHNMVIGFATIFSMLIFGVAADKLGLNMALLISFSVCFIAALVFWITLLLKRSNAT
jgi:MFS family permease